MLFRFILPMNFDMQFEVYVMSDLWLYSILTLRGAYSLFLQMVKFVMGLTSHAPGWEANHLSEIYVLLLSCMFENVPLKHIFQDLSFIFCISSNRA
jgi:hypothetical protein